MTREEVNEIFYKTFGDPDGYVSEWRGYLEVRLEHFDRLKRRRLKDQVWLDVEEAARRLQKHLSRRDSAEGTSM